MEGIFIKINLRKANWLIFATYLPPWQGKSYHFDIISKALDLYGAKYENMILVGDFNTKELEQVFSAFIYEQHLHNIVSFPACFKV